MTIRDFKNIEEELCREREANDEKENEIKKKQEKMDLLWIHIEAKINKMSKCDVKTNKMSEVLLKLLEKGFIWFTKIIWKIVFKNLQN